MVWKWHKKQQKPLVPGRDRPKQAGSRPQYLYYKARPSDNTGTSTRSRPNASPEKKRVISGMNIHTAMLLVCVVIGLLCALKIVLLTPNSKIVITENVQTLDLPQNAYAETANSSLKSSLLNRNKITLNTRGVATDIEQRFPELASVVVTVPLVGNRPIVYVTPSRASFMIESPMGLYSLADNGYVLAKLPAPEKELVTMAELSNRVPEVGKQFLPASTVSFARTVKFQMQQAGFTISRIVLPSDAPYEMQLALVGKSYLVRFNLQADALQQSGGAVAVLQQLEPTARPEYIDVRVLGRAYYK
ncbi:hypothetical protein IPL85_03725 [Candidatus Saccharibacteria bacterium]|nr:MAG: hypothetical protein IPL85_03725 [Candidatus Saccharibacteria bacterium]